MKKRLLTGLVGLALAGGIFWGFHSNHSAETPLAQTEEETFMLLTDVHFLAPELHDTGKAFTFIKATAAGKDLEYQTQSLQAFVAEALATKPQGVIITGDLTLNGEKISGEQLAKELAPLKEQGIALYCLPGNHDLYDGWARSFHGDKQAKTAQISPEDFKKIFPDGYKDSRSTAPDDLSYALSVSPDYRFVLLDSNHYPMTESRAQPATGGSIRDSTMTWLETQLKEAQQNHQQTLVFLHHNLLQHNDTVNQGYVLDNAVEVKKLLKDYGVKVVFSGHIHAQDIMAEDDLTEIVTSSYNIIDHGYGLLKLSDSQVAYDRKTISVSDWAKGKPGLPAEVYQHDTYLKDLFLNDGERLAYETLLNQGITDKETLETGADFLGQVNLDFFQGNDERTTAEVAELKKDPGYQLLAQDKFLKDYLDGVLQDKNLADQHWRSK
ncbi:metallophosphoesterase [Enterococcus asini]|uniref:metallophosphoesterase n=1 Tax=Enterococcus asini TaxID=57732 RepID=UPI00266C6301|nr:metallophosphoesterase [Enterococcus asini]